MLERIIWWLDMCSALTLVMTGLYVAVVFSDVLNPSIAVLMSSFSIICFMLQFEILCRRWTKVRAVLRHGIEAKLALDNK